MYYVERSLIWEDDYFDIQSDDSILWLVKADSIAESAKKVMPENGDNMEDFFEVSAGAISKVADSEGKYISYRALKFNFDDIAETIRIV